MEAGAGAGATRTRVLLGEMGERAMSRMWEAGGTHLGVKSASWLPVRWPRKRACERVMQNGLSLSKPRKLG